MRLFSKKRNNMQKRFLFNFDRRIYHFSNAINQIFHTID